MVLVFYIILILLLLLITYVNLLMISTLKVSLIDFDFFLDTLDINKATYGDGYILKFESYLFNKIKIFEYTLDSAKAKKMHVWEKVRKINYEKVLKKLDINKKNIKEFRKIDFNISDFDLKIDIGTASVIITPFIVTGLSTLISILLSKYSKRVKLKKCKYYIKPIYLDKNIIKVKFDCIINVKIGHIIHVLFKLIKRRDDKNGRTSNRRAYDYSYE